MNLKQQLKMKIKQDGITFSKFWKDHIKESCHIMYATFMNQLDERNNMQPEIEAEIVKYLNKGE
jgi:hypothetical protein